MKKLFQWIRNAILSVVSDVFEIVEEKGPEAVQIAQQIKKAIEENDGTIHWITQLTASSKDDQFVAWVKAKLPGIVKEIAMVDGLVTDKVDPEVAARIYGNYILTKTKEGRAKEWADLAARILIAIIGKKVPMDIAIMVTQKFYRILFAKK